MEDVVWPNVFAYFAWHMSYGLTLAMFIHYVSAYMNHWKRGLVEFSEE